MVLFEKANRFKNSFPYSFVYCSVWQVSFNEGTVLIGVFKLRVFPLLSHAIGFTFYKPKASLCQGFYKGEVFFPHMNKIILIGVRREGETCTKCSSSIYG